MASRRFASLFAAFALAVVLCGTLLGQSQPAATASGNEADHAALRALVPVYEQAANEGKPDLLSPYVHPQFSGVMVSADEVVGLDGLKKYWADMKRMMGDGSKYQVKINVAAPAEIVGDTAIAHGTSSEDVTMSGKQYHYDGLWTAVLKKQDGQWKLLRVHASMYPISNPFVREIVQGASFRWGFIGGAAGLLLALILSFSLRRRKAAA